MIPYVTEQGEKVGIKFKYEGKIGNTFDSHRLVEFAKDKGKQDELVDTLMSYYFEQKRDISDKGTLNEIASKVGLDAKAFLESKEKEELVAEELLNARRMQITGVPAFIINNKYLVSGAQDTSTWEEVLKEEGYEFKSS
ncbi:hypothetical protein AAMO2058_001627800 [Amorphochlora amoebiformis]|mmetsp:Transcript_34883/g.56271  ORF Transcript_34883/g.56271 Transcript_34883/m.56271 type:complete len:139 (-) Transcript_34883:336-752(-)